MRRNTLLGLLGAVMLAVLVAVPSVSAWAMDASYHAPVGPYQTLVYSGTDMGIPASSALTGSGTKTGTLINSNGTRNVSVSVTASHPYSATLTTYMDDAGTVVQEAVTDTGSTNAAKVLRTTANYPYRAWKVSITDTSGTSGTCQAAAGVAQN